MQVMEQERIWAFRTLKSLAVNPLSLSKKRLIMLLRASGIPFPEKDRFISYLEGQPDEFITLFLEDLQEGDHLG